MHVCQSTVYIQTEDHAQEETWHSDNSEIRVAETWQEPCRTQKQRRSRNDKQDSIDVVGPFAWEPYCKIPVTPMSECRRQARERHPVAGSIKATTISWNDKHNIIDVVSSFAWVSCCKITVRLMLKCHSQDHKRHLAARSIKGIAIYKTSYWVNVQEA